MSKPPRIKLKTLIGECDYFNKLSDEDKEFFIQFELLERFGINGSKEDRAKANARNYRKKCDWMNVSTDTIMQHMSIYNKRKARLRVLKNEEDMHGIFYEEETDREPEDGDSE